MAARIARNWPQNWSKPPRCSRVGQAGSDDWRSNSCLLSFTLVIPRTVRTRANNHFPQRGGTLFVISKPLAPLVLFVLLARVSVAQLAGPVRWPAERRKNGTTLSLGSSAATFSRARPSTSWKCGSRRRSTPRRSIASWVGRNRSVSTRFEYFCTICPGTMTATHFSRTSNSFWTSPPVTRFGR